MPRHQPVLGGRLNYYPSLSLDERALLLHTTNCHFLPSKVQERMSPTEPFYGSRQQDMPKPSPLPGPRQSNFQARKLLRTGTRHPRLKGDSRPEEGWPVTNWKDVDVDGGKPGLILLPHECAAILAVCPRPQSARNTR